ncbi:N-acetyl-gamma-glutamyl-phosphate reductase [Cytobacillus purgationiresistens]|uniref:N-acetyl-gamma-glutamyl-phosphate reductase n=1 Tax=Cytobacillus purgationiresistens TaxID=863449 RepID=A0ABU0ABY3_9BACI|nr:N-acetyl-gamma-glutamyl-phosphate reductase [Cytobacillus purgationiresistens]MDQ0268765.1 N-acetyl-gamma-glutamyl-phosphate reductase [Cytobacillus purgationiresistens]
MKASIIGTTGYGGAELLRILNHHPEFEIQSIHSTKEDLPIWHEYPHLYKIVNQKLQGIHPDEIAANADIVFLATPSGISGQLAGKFVDKDIKVIDLSGDLRIEAGQYEKWYKKDPVSQELIDEAIYGLSEWNAEAIKGASLIANPGCYPTATLLSLAPVIKENMIDPDSIIVDAKSGISGAGRSPSRKSSFSEANENFSAYKVNEHQHTPEIEKQLLQWNERIKPITFTTQLLPITRGIMTTSYVKLNNDCRTSKLLEFYENVYNECPFVRIRTEKNYPSVKEVAGSNYCDIGLNVDERTGRLTIISVIDNLMKGAAGQAVQNANIMFGINETTGLDFIPLYP